ncbi:hypothetical protein ACWC0C_34415 [Streptomyces sp. NPDC001709]
MGKVAVLGQWLVQCPAQASLLAEPYDVPDQAAEFVCRAVGLQQRCGMRCGGRAGGARVDGRKRVAR